MKINLNITAELAAASKALAPAAKRLRTALAEAQAYPEKLPQGAAADLRYSLGQLTAQLNQLTVAFDGVIADTIKVLDEHFIKSLQVGEASGVQGAVGRIQITESPVPIPEDWDLIYKHVLKTKDFSLLGKQLNRDTIRDLWKDKKRVPGIGKFNAKKVSVTKLRGAK